MNKVNGRPRNDTFTFEVDAALLFQLGEQLVARRSIALAELIKNAYDADATKVTVKFDGVTKPSGVITVQDDGNGMTLADVQRGWMRVAGSQKTELKQSKTFHRPLTGAKGVGRFATRRLAKRLTIFTVGIQPDGTRERVVVRFDWEKFHAGVDLTQIPVHYRTAIVDPTTPTGVILRLRHVRDIWEQGDAEDVRRDLLGLVTPTIAPKDQEANDKGFSIELSSNEFPDISGEFSDFFLQSAWAKLTGYVDPKGLPHYTLTRRGLDREDHFSPDREEVYTAIAGVSMTIYYVVYKTGFIQGLGVRDASSYGREQGGVRLYLDGFRVFPYGEPGDDWLGLDYLKAARHTTFPSNLPIVLQQEASKVYRALLNIPGNYQLFGSVYISQTEQHELQLTMSRERLIENEAFSQLTEFIKNGLFWLTILYSQFLLEEGSKNKQETPKTASSTLSDLEKLVDQSEEISDALKSEIKYQIRTAREVAAGREADLISELSLLRILASAGTMVLVFTHQMRAIVDNLARINADLRDMRVDIPVSLRPQFDDLVEQLKEWRTTVEDQASQLGLLVSNNSRTQRKRLAVYEVVEGVIRPLRSYTRELGVSVVNQVPPNLRTPPMFEAELHAILINLFTNALKAVRGQPQREILVDGYRSDFGVGFRMSDTGMGLDRDKWLEVFRPLVTSSEPDPILGVGTGIGLTVVRDLVATYGGTSRFVDPMPLYNTTVELFFPKEV